MEVGAAGAPRYIRLRNETIDTARVASGLIQTTAPPQAQPGEASGLFLIQFQDHLQPSWRGELAARRVTLLSYVPDDAFVARLDRVSLAELSAFPFVRWVGAYRPDHKIFRGLLAQRQARRADELESVTVLVAPAAPPGEVFVVRRTVQRPQQDVTHRFGTVLRGQVMLGQLQALAESPAVLWIEPGPKIKLFDQVSSEIVAGEGGPQSTFTQDLGFTGAGVAVSVADSGLHTGTTNGMHPDLLGRVLALFHYGSLLDASDEHSHGTHVTGIVAGNGAVGETDEFGALYGLGVAPEASIIAQRIFDGFGNYEAPPSFEVLTHDAVRAGADIGSNSWGDDTQGRYDVSAAEFDALVRDADFGTAGDQPYTLEFSAGNAGPGPQTIGSPAVAKNVIASGAAQNNRFDFLIYEDGQEAMADFSSRGPAEDGRIKPDVVAPGTWIASLRSTFSDDNNAWADISQNYLYQGGTSQSGPHVSGAAAVFIQYYRDTYAIGDPSPALVKAALIHSAVDMDDSFGTAPTPNMDEGWGRVDLTELILADTSHDFVDQSVLLASSQVHERQLVIASSSQPLRVTLVYTDFPGFPAVLPALVNDLDLELIAPNGQVYRGNQFEPATGESVPDAPASDNINNVEGIYIDVPQPGEYLVRILARNIVQDSRGDTPAVDQDFALVVCGDIPPMEAGTLFLDRSAYRAPGRIQIKLIDADLHGNASQSVVLRSATETNGLLVTLLPSGGPGVFTGSVATAIGPPASDAFLQIAHGNWITAEYFDVTYATLRVASATGDFVPPFISQVSITNQFGATVVSWMTDEPANALVRFNTNATLSRVASNAIVHTFHQVELTNLVVGSTYYFRVESTDIAGNTATNNNGGANHSFVAQPVATVLIVDGYVDQSEAPIIPISTYTDALAQIGVTYDVWDVDTHIPSLPSLANLRPYRVVIWRVNDASLAGSSEFIPAPQQTAIQQYLNSGGSFFMASMEIISRLLANDSGAFVTNVLHIRQFTPNPNPFEQCTSCDEDVGVADIEGDPQDPVSNGVLVSLDYNQYPDFLGFIGPDISDTFTPATNATPILYSIASGKPCGMRFPRTGQDSTGRVVFCSFPFDTLPASGTAPNTRAGFMRNVIQFLVPEIDGFGTIALSQSDYKLPDFVTVEVSDGDLAGLPGPVVQFHSDSAPSPVSITLQETTQPGLFRGFVSLADMTVSPAPGLLRAAHNDRIYAQYFDASGSAMLTAEADVDSVAPVITGLNVTPGYDTATFVWDTDEPTDALVQFGESTFLGRTAYLPDLDFAHEVTLNGLDPDRTYYYQVVSQDAAGNTRIDDNNGQFYTFQTLVPLRPPVMDSFDTASGWTVFNSDDTTSEWTLGSPNNGIETMAHSPVNCWGSSRLGEDTDLIDTFLISPAIELTGGNVATLKFWHQWDFTERTSFDLLEGGELLIFTNSLTTPVLLNIYEDFSFGWEPEEIDLTPYVGRVIFLVWHHQLLAFESASRPGWLLDDVCVTITNVPPVTLRITNNLAQAQFFLTGPGFSQAGHGYETVITNARPGTYSVNFQTVAYYQTPPPQTNTLAAGSTGVFTGNYWFPDANSNEISDTWELQYWSTVSPSRTRSTDTDFDGFTDYAEFVAGTNPTLTNSHLRVTAYATQANGSLHLQWPTVSGRIYQVQATANFSNWFPRSPWLRAAGSITSFTVPWPAPGQPYVHRVEVRP